MNPTLVRNTMRTFIQECRDPLTGEINCTKLAEETARALNLYVGDVIPEELFDLAVELSQEYEEQKRR